MWNLVGVQLVSQLGGQTVVLLMDFCIYLYIYIYIYIDLLVLLNNRALFRQFDHGWHDARHYLIDERGHGCPTAVGRLVVQLCRHTYTHAYIGLYHNFKTTDDENITN